MPHSITPLDVQSFASKEIYRKGERIFENNLVKNRFQTNFGLKAIVRGSKNYHTEMIIDHEQLFGRCSCHVGNSPCEHQVAVLLAWLNEPESFVSYQVLRKAIKLKDKNALADILINLCEAFPDLSRLFVTTPGMDELQAIEEDVADIFDFPHTDKIDPHEIMASFQILFIRAKILRSEGKYTQARTIYFKVLQRILALIDSRQLSASFPENTIMDIADDYEEIALSDGDFDDQIEQLTEEVQELSGHEAAEHEGLFFEQIKEKIAQVK
jgi:hypothetical protein